MSAPPRLSLLLMGYQQRATVEQAVASCLAQTGAPLQIVLSDDASTDGSYEAMARLAAAYRGPHRVQLNRNPRNLGIGGHFNRLVELADGELLVLAAGDDVSLPQRCERIAAAWEAAGRRPDLVAHPLIDLDADGVRHGTIAVDDLARWDLARWVRERPRVVGAGHAWTRRLDERFGPLDPAIAYEDQVHALRALLGGGAITLDEPLVAYRRGGTSASARPASAEAVRARLQLQNRRHLAEAEQLLQDARTAGAEAVLAPALLPELARQRAFAAQLAAAGWAEAWRALRAHPQAPLAWRLRKAWAVRMAALAAWRHRRARAGAQT
ncbi:glycosyltransferase family 2 protein [Piscinibacter sakaiensis]|uniref:Glycosyl transferase n=1 Tax=Piscinibacter sakaiensis TaxID=1547922 RepID=A0A0K8P235_PISS1|nr:glycosyltransferase [Piscinibacter sakaiensis]GAP36663.1 glycosyl transferase [Piscinibacter sakaiensis]